MKTLSLVIALVSLIAVGAVTQSFADEYWIVRDEVGMPTVTNQRPADLTAGVSGPFKYLDEAVRDMGTGTEWRARCYISGLCTTAKHIGK
jgi:hypothetical protein